MYLMKKKFSKKPNAETYYYVVENKIINGRPTPIHVRYLGSIRKILEVFEFWEKQKER